MATEISRQRAAQAWCKPETSKIEMIPELAEAFAEILDEIWSRPWLGNATTAELIDEIRARIEIEGRLYYRTVNCKDQKSKAKKLRAAGMDDEEATECT